MKRERACCAPAAAFVLHSLAVVAVIAASGALAECTLQGAASAAGVPVGAAVAPTLITVEPDYASTLAAEFNSVTAENVMKWAAVQPQRGSYDFAPADALIDFADAHAMAVRGHTLIWDQAVIDSTPAWVTAITDPDELRAVMTDHIQTVVGRYAGRIDAWDVVNEPLETGGSQLFNNVFQQLLGPGYIREALEIAHATDPAARLFLNEVLISFPGAKLDALVTLVEDLLAEGAPLHGVGIQGHFLFAPNSTALQQSIEALAATGVIVELTEVDVLLRGPGSEEERLARQADDYLGVASACLAVPACRRVTLWGFTDAHTWLDSFVGPGSMPLLFDAAYARKPAFFAVRQALDAAAGANRPVAGKKLVIEGGAASPKPKLVLGSRDESITPSFGDPGASPLGAGATLRVVNPVTRAASEVELDAAGWRGLGKPAGARGYRYRDTSGGACRRTVVKRGRLKLACTGSELFALEGTAQGALAATVRLGCGAIHCMEFGGRVTADVGAAAAAKTRFAAKNAPAPAACAAQY